MKIIIVAGSPVKSFSKLYHKNPSDYYIGVDSGCLELINRGIKMDIAIGDFDSTDKLDLIKEHSYSILTYPKEKNETDLELALMHLDTLKGSIDLEVEIYDALGSRLDHEFNAYMLLAKYSQYKLKLIDEENQVVYRKSKDIYKIRGGVNYFSIFADKKSVISICNAKYPLIDQTIDKSDTYLVSNEMLDKNLQPTIEIKKGGVYIFINSHK